MFDRIGIAGSYGYLFNILGPTIPFFHSSLPFYIPTNGAQEFI